MKCGTVFIIPPIPQSYHLFKKNLRQGKMPALKFPFYPENELAESYGMNGEYGILSQKGATLNAYSLTHALLQYCHKKGS